MNDSRIRVLLEVIRQSFPSVRSIARATDLSIENTHRHLRALRRDGFVDWLDGANGGTLHALVEEVPVGG